LPAIPIDPGPCRWNLPEPDQADEHGLAGIGADLEPATLLAAYRCGLFPMPVSRRFLGWWSPDPRGIIPLDGLHVSRSLRRSLRRYRVEVDTAFRAVMRQCADVRRDHGWITKGFVDAYCRLHELGWTHSVECYGQDGTLVGGLYGVRIGGLFAGESMFSLAPDASKVALVSLVEMMMAERMQLLDVQWVTPHLATLGAVAVPRAEYLTRLQDAIRC
jgi:leucyl/phenylalanyl-tRNA--protein transferase